MGVLPYPNCICVLKSLGTDRVVAHRLAKLGVLPGTKLRVVRTGPMGDPIELAVEGGQSIALRGKEALALECDSVTAPLPAFARVSEEQIYRVRQLIGGPNLQRKLTERGLSEGVLVRIVRRRPFVVRTTPEEREIVLGHGEASKVLLETIGDQDA